MNTNITFESEFAKQHPDRMQIVNYLHNALGLTSVDWSDLTKLNLSTFAEHVKERVSPNSARTYFAVLCGFLGKYQEENIIPCKKPSEVLKAKKVPQQNVALTEDELKKIERYYDGLLTMPGHQPEKDCLTLFLLESYCGARACDTEGLSEKNIQDGMLSYVSQKTHVLATMPVHKKIPLLLSRKPKREYFTYVKNRIIKRVAQKCGIDQPVTIFYHGALQTKPKYEFLGTHTARRTFASILAGKGAPLAEISQFMSHSNQLMTSRYIKVDTQQASPQALSFFNS